MLYICTNKNNKTKPMQDTINTLKEMQDEVMMLWGACHLRDKLQTIINKLEKYENHTTTELEQQTDF